MTMQMPLNLAATIRWAIADGKITWDIARRVEESLAVCEANAGLFDAPGLQGPVKRAELVVKLGYWLALGQMTPADFREWIERIPPEDNLGWDVDLCPRRPGSALPPVLKMGLQAAVRPACPAAEG